MTKKALVIDDVAVNVCPTADLSSSFYPDVAADFIDVPDDVVVGSTFDGSDWHAPEDPFVFDPITGTNAQRKARKLEQLEAYRASRAYLGIVTNGFWSRMDPAKFSRMTAAAIVILADPTVTQVSWDAITGEFVTYFIDPFLFTYRGIGKDIQDTNECSITLATAILAVDDTQSTADYQADLDAIDIHFVPDPDNLGDSDFGPWPTWKNLTYP